MKAFDDDTITVTVCDTLAIESRARPWDIKSLIISDPREKKDLRRLLRGSGSGVEREYVCGKWVVNMGLGGGSRVEVVRVSCHLRGKRVFGGGERGFVRCTYYRF